MAEKKAKEKILFYRGKPLLRDGSVLYYGDFNDNFIVRMTVTETKKINQLKIATKVSIELLEKHGDSIETARLTKKAERTSIWAALDLGVYWLEDILEMEREFLAKLAAAQA
ncbi:MAG: hypothetical protein IJB48_07460 [Clostridia bacterium]|nr:hypothetical protein [Clostridia bacterium]MBQ3553607.1 hypothetical protein [Clostridia bacterium]